MIGKNGVSLLIGHNGVQDKTTLDPANETVARGIYDATLLSTVDAELATVNIKNGITIFGFAGDADVRDISDATAIEAEVITGETFYAASGGIRTGTMPVVALDPDANAYPGGYHVGAANLTAVDGDLVAGNIADGITIFGVLGTLVAGALAEDVVGSAVTTLVSNTSGTFYNRTTSLAAETEVDIVSKVLTFDATSIAVADGQCFCEYQTPTDAKLRLYMGGVMVAESAFIAVIAGTQYVVVATRALSGSQTCKLSVYNYDSVTAGDFTIHGDKSGQAVAAGIGIGSIKLV